MRVKITLKRMARLAAAVCILLGVHPLSAEANGGPTIEHADANGNLLFDDASNIRLVAEKIKYFIRDPDGTQDTEVRVEYELHSRNSHAKTIDILFLTPASGDFTVSEGNRQVRTSPATRGVPINWTSEIRYDVVEPVSGKTLKLTKNYGIKSTGTRFDLTFEPNETKHIVIRYHDNGGMYDRGVINKVFSHLYYLTPAEFWDGDPKVELEIQFAQSGSRIHSNLPLKRDGPLSYKAKFDRLPDGEWYFSFTYPKRLLFPTNVERDHNLLVLATAAVLTAIAAGAALKLRNKLIFLLSGLGIFAFVYYYITKMGGYPFNPVFVGFTDLMVGLILVLCFAKIRRRINTAA